LGYRFYYGSRITELHPAEDSKYFGSSITFSRYNDIKHREYQKNALKVILWARKLRYCKKSAKLLSKLEAKYIKTALNNLNYLGPSICLNRNCSGRIILTPEELTAAQKRGNAVVAQKYAKTYTLTSPRGKQITFTNLRKFCRENNLDRSALRRVYNGRLKSYKGWTKL
jgi:hypothetical protein